MSDAPMRIAIISDIHDNLTALEAVLASLRDTSPDLIFLTHRRLRSHARSAWHIPKCLKN